MNGFTVDQDLPHACERRGKAADFSQPFFFDNQTHKPNKTVDIGCDGVSLSLDGFGRVSYFGHAQSAPFG